LFNLRIRLSFEGFLKLDSEPAVGSLEAII
jgi:hypothetical protein